ncbi:MAG: thioredoxin [candidate division WOR-3 bacterium]|jgi:thioredoxin 1
MSKHLNDVEFEKVISEKGNIVIDFWAEWCMPCRKLEPVLEELEKEIDIEVYKLNVDDYPHIAEKFNIFSIPTLLCYKDGKLIDRVVGFIPKNKLLEKFKDIFKL